MTRMTREEIKGLTDSEVKIAYKRIQRDFSYGLVNDRVTPVENTRLLEEELKDRGVAVSN